MPGFSIQVDDSHAMVRLDAIGPNVRQALARVLKPMAAEISEDARARAAAHIRFLGGKPGAYLGSIYGGVSEKGARIVGFVRSASPIAHLLEFGAQTPPHEILATAAEVLAFEGDAGTVFRKAVHSPGATIPPYPAIYPAFEAAQDRVVEEMTKAIKQVAAQP